MNHIEELLDKYYNGETSTEEEKILRRFFSQQEIPGRFKADGELFRFFMKERESELPGNLEERLIGTLSPSSVTEAPMAAPGGEELVKPVFRLRVFWMSGIAAAILILAGIFVDLRIRRHSPMIDTYKDPYLAYAEAKRVLYLVSDKMNEATKPLKNLDRIDEGVTYMQPVFTFGEGIQYMGKISTVEKTRKLISK